MGKRIIVQRRGKGTSVYKAPSHRYKGEVTHRRYDEKEKKGVVKGRITDILHDPGRSTPLVQVEFEDGEKGLMPALEGMKVGDEVACGVEAEITRGNTLPLANIPEGTPISNVENLPGDGGKFIRASGSYGLVIAHDVDKAVIQLPSGELKTLDPRCRATIGIIAGGGRVDKPILKAGKMWHVLKPTARYWPKVRKVAMNPVDHPHGGGSRRPGKPASVSRNAPPGQKVGLIAPRRTGRK
jgi:large subunit ribosomal protein L2